jgi:molybdopterin-synthase adenylyltransferase
MTTAGTAATETAWRDIVDRQTGLLTREQNEILRGTRLLMLGIGGMGMNAAAHLVRMGFERFTLVDFDVIDGTSANRNPFAFDDTMGVQKVEAARKYMLKINPAADIRTCPNVKLGLDSPSGFMEELVRGHDVLSWAMDGMAGRIHYTRVTHLVGAEYAQGKPAVESWAVPYHFCAWTVPNARGTPSWERCFDLPTASVPSSELTPEMVGRARKEFLGRFIDLPQLRRSLPPKLVDDWLNLRVPNRTIGALVVGCSTLIAYEIMLNALKVGGAPLQEAPIHYAPWMVFYDLRRNSAYERNFMTRKTRWIHPLTGTTVEEDG